MVRLVLGSIVRMLYEISQSQSQRGDTYIVSHDVYLLWSQRLKEVLNIYAECFRLPVQHIKKTLNDTVLDCDYFAS